MNATSRRPITVEDLWAFRRIGAPAASPDGSLIIFPVTAFDMEKNEGKTRLYRMHANGEPTPLTSADVGWRAPRRTPSWRRS